MSKSSKKKQEVITLPVTSIKSKINTKSVPVGEAPDINLKTIIFSYKYFSCNCLKNKEFNNCFKNISDYAKWITFCIERISNLSSMKIGEISNSGKSLRFHPVTKEPLIKLKEILKSINVDVDKIFIQEESENYYEISFGKGNGRIFGYLIENIYFILLMDPNHLVYFNPAKGQLDLLYKNYNPWENLLDGTNQIQR